MIIEIFDPMVEHTAGVLLLKVTASPEVALAVSAAGVALNGCEPGLLKVIICAAWAIVMTRF